MLRQLIVTLMGNVDAGKSTIIDKIKRTSIVKSEPGQITQSIKSYNVSLEIIKKLCKGLVDPSKITIPGLMFIDTPGHAAFSNLRKRGGSLADIAILLIDINEGIKPQTEESIEILKEAKTPFIIALNKIDLVHGWISQPEKQILQSLAAQQEGIKQIIDTRIYGLLAKFYEKEISIERFDRVDDYTKTVAVVPLSAKTGEGIAELMMVLVGLAQKYMETSLKCNVEGAAKGTILEVTEEKSLGTTFDAIIYDGTIKKADQIVLGTMQGPLSTKVKAIFSLDDQNKLKPVEEAHAAIGIKLVCSETKNVIAGMPLIGVKDNLESAKQEILDQIEEITFELDEDGIILKADSIGSLEALITNLKDKGVRIKRASIGLITKKDIAEANSNSDELNKVILGFAIPETQAEEVKIISSNVIYSLFDKFEEWRTKKQEEIEKEKWKGVTKPCKIKILPGYVFRQSNPAVVGVEVEAGTLKQATSFFIGKNIINIKELQDQGKTVQEAKKGDQIAVSMPNITVGRQIKEGDILYSNLSETDFRKLKELKSFLNTDEIQILKEIADAKRKDNSMWGV